MQHSSVIISNQVIRALIKSRDSFTQDDYKFQHLFIWFIGQRICDLHICQALHINWGPKRPLGWRNQRNQTPLRGDAGHRGAKLALQPQRAETLICSHLKKHVWCGRWQTSRSKDCLTHRAKIIQWSEPEWTGMVPGKACISILMHGSCTEDTQVCAKSV